MAMDEFEKLFRQFEKAMRSLQNFVAKRIREEIARLAEELSLTEIPRPLWHHEGYLEPLYSVKDLGDRIVIDIDLPCVDEGSIDVKFVGNRMMLVARLKRDLRYENWSSRAREITFREYRLTIDLPPDVDPSRARVKVIRNVVRVEIPRI